MAKLKRLKRGATPHLFLLVPVGLLVAFTYLPVANMLWYSLTEWDGLDRNKEFVGTENYREIFTRPELFGVFWVSVYYLFGAFIQIVLALYLATILSFKTRLRNVFKGIIFFPYLINGVAIAFIFLYVFQPGGVLDQFLDIVGLEQLQRSWLGDRDTVNYSLAGVSVWRFLGLNFVLFLGAIQSIPSEIHEAAHIDGANSWQRFRFIILPGIRPVVSLSVILAVAGALSAFEIPYIMLFGANGSRTFVIQTVDTAFKFQKVGLASAMAVVLLVLILLVTWVQRIIVPDTNEELA